MVSGAKLMEKSGEAKASATYLRIAALPTMGGVSGCRMVASSDQNAIVFSTSRDFAAASHCASVERIAASSFARSAAAGVSDARRAHPEMASAKRTRQDSLEIRIFCFLRKQKRPASLPAVCIEIDVIACR